MAGDQRLTGLEFLSCKLGTSGLLFFTARLAIDENVTAGYAMSPEETYWAEDPPQHVVIVCR